MIVLMATQEKILSVLQSIAGIVERRHSLPVLANVLLRNGGLHESDEAYEPNKTARAAAQLFRPASSQLQIGFASVQLTIGLKSLPQGRAAVGRGFVGFFSSTKANLRNAP